MLRLKESIRESYIYEPFTKQVVLGKFIDKKLYKHLYKKFPDFFELGGVEKKEKKESK